MIYNDYFDVLGKILILSHNFHKKKQKTPDKSLEYPNIIIKIQHQNSMKSCSSTSSTWLKPFFHTDSLDTTDATVKAYGHCQFLSIVNGRLIINEVENEKYLYRDMLDSEYRIHSSEVGKAHMVIDEKNDIILYMEETIDKLKKEYRVLADDYVQLKDRSVEEQQFFRREIETMENKCQEKIKSIEQQLQKTYELKMCRKVDEVTRQCEDRIKLYKNQIESLTENSTQLTHQLKMLENQYKEMLQKTNLMLQENLNWELRKRDYQAQNNYLRDVAQYEALLRDNRELKEQVDDMRTKMQLMDKQKKEYEKLFEGERNKYNNLVETFQSQKKQNESMQNKYRNLKNNCADAAQSTITPDKTSIQFTNPIDQDLISQIIALREFTVQKLIDRFLNFFNKTAITHQKKKSLSITTFINSFELLKQTHPQNKIIVYILGNLERMVKLYCPVMTYGNEYEKIKDQFVKSTIKQCDGIDNPTQKLYRILQLVYRLRYPLTHSKSQISPVQLRAMEIKLIDALRRALGP